MISQAGKVVLMKTMVHAIPSYYMNSFLLPLTTCQEIEQATMQFSWGATDEDRKHHWCMWDVLRRTKAKGGVGFRELYFFNLAMLGKQLWNLMKQFRAYRILKAKYFPQTNMLQPTKGVVEEGI